MKKFLSIILALSMLLCLAACNKEGGKEQETEESKQEEAGRKIEGDLKAIYDKVNESVDIAGNVSYVVTKAEDDDRAALMMNYDICDPYAADYPEEFNAEYVEASDKLTDYIISLPKDDCTTFVVLRFDEGLPSEGAVNEIKSRVKNYYCDMRASAIQMYDQEGYEEMVWAIENQDLVWRQYDNAMVLIITGGEEPKAAFDAFEAAAIK